MSDKYIIRNCNVIYFNPDKTAICNDLMLECPCECKDRTDCVMKRIVDECKWETNNINIDLRGDLAERILSELDIQECEG